MIKTWLKHKICDYSLSIFFDNILMSFNTPSVLCIKGLDMTEHHVGMKVYGILRHTRFGYEPSGLFKNTYVIKDDGHVNYSFANSKVSMQSGSGIEPVVNKNIYFLE